MSREVKSHFFFSYAHTSYYVQLPPKSYLDFCSNITVLTQSVLSTSEWRFPEKDNLAIGNNNIITFSVIHFWIELLIKEYLFLKYVLVKLNEIATCSKNTFLSKRQLTPFLTYTFLHVHSAFTVSYFLSERSALLSDVLICFSPKPVSLSTFPTYSSPSCYSPFPTDMGILGSQGCPYSIIKVWISRSWKLQTIFIMLL